MNIDEAKELLQKYKQGTCTESEKNILERWYFQYKKDGDILSELEMEELEKEVWLTLPIHTAKTPSQIRIIYHRFKKGLIAAAALLLFATAGLYYYTYKQDSITDTQFTVIDVEPGGNKATLVLADGRIIDLDDNKDGVVIDAKKLVYNDGTTVSENANLETEDTNRLNTISTPAGGQYKVVLPDGSTVWLNASSSLKFPNKFDESIREVEVKGEAYFDIVKVNSSSTKPTPFVVKSINQSVEVLGTQFNINAYEDENNVKTTLIEGSIKLNQLNNSAKNNAVILRPNQQGIITENASTIKVATVNPASIIAWKEGVFRFDHASIYTLMRQLERWYDIEVKYENGIKYEPFYGEIKRSNNLSEVLKVLEIGGVHFNLNKINGKTILTVKS